MSKVSIVVPLYNTEPYIAECIASIKRQTISDFECFVVDDSSTDGSLAAAKDAVNGDPRFHLMQNPCHIGAGATRNKGIANATGEFLYLMDSDDSLADSCFERTVNFIEENSLDMAMFNVRCINEDAPTHKFHHEFFYLKRSINYGMSSGREMLVKMIRNMNFACNPFMYMTRTSSIQHLFPEVQLDEDMLYTIKNMASMKLVGHLPEELYIKKTRRDSLLHAQMTFDRTISMMDVVLDLAKWVSKGFASREFSKDFSDAIELQLELCSYEAATRWKSLPEQERKKIDDLPYCKRILFKQFIK